MQTDNIYNVLNNYLKRSNRDSTNEVICRFMMNHLLEIPQMSVNEIADACFTSHPSIIRFTRELGFEGMADFKYNVQNYIDEVRSGEMRVSFPVEILSDEERFQQTLKAWLDVQSRIIVSSIQSDVREKTRRLCEEIQAHKRLSCLEQDFRKSFWNCSGLNWRAAERSSIPSEHRPKLSKATTGKKLWSSFCQ